MLKNIITLSAVAAMATSALANTDMESRVSLLEKELKKLEKKLKKSNKKLNEVKAHDANDNIKFDVEFRNTFEKINYKNNETGETASNNSLVTSRLFLNMASAPTDNLTFRGKLAIYSIWGAHLIHEDKGTKDWSGSSKPSNSIMRIKEGYFVYNTEVGEQPLSFSIGRRPASNGWLANYRENESTSGSPLAHITNMEVNGGMVQFNFDRFVEGSYTKIVLGRAHSGETTGAYGTSGINPFADLNTVKEDENVNFLVIPGVAYNDGQYEVMYEWAHIFDTKGKNADTNQTSVDAGAADLFSLGLKVEGIGDEISDFLDETTVFASIGHSVYSAEDGYKLLTDEVGATKTGSSLWVGAIIPDGITDEGKFGFEYNQGSKYWTPMTWAEDTNIGSKIAVRGQAYETYWNTNLFGQKNLTSQVRYTYIQHDYTPNINCAGWVPSEAVDITASSLRFAITYKY
ncbi:MAG: DUF3373 family protein [Campylobacterota bacterium]|nr:DUF3373 family protein [Campylobacterota bacterium]